jgi:hypothetical protein
MKQRLIATFGTAEPRLNGVGPRLWLNKLAEKHTRSLVLPAKFHPKILAEARISVPSAGVAAQGH